MAQDYDKILKENVGEIFLSLSEKYLGLKVFRYEELKDKLQTTLEREADFLRLVETEQGERFILHLEFQTTNEPEFIYRMQEYHAILKKKYRLPIRQHVIYLGQKPMTMRHQLGEHEVFRGFKLHDISHYSIKQLLESEVSEEVILAVLSNFSFENASETIKKIISRLKQLNSNPILLSKYVRQLTVLSRLRGLSKEFKKHLQDMALTYDIEKDAFYQEGIEKGILEGKRSSQFKTAKRCLLKGMKVNEVAELTELSLEEVVKISQEMGLQ